MDLNLNKVIESKIPSHREEAEALFDDVKLRMVLPSGEELEWSYPVGESLQTLILRLYQLHDINTQKLYLEEKKEESFLMDPMSLNDFDKIKQLHKEGKEVKIIVDGKSVQ